MVSIRLDEELVLKTSSTFNTYSGFESLAYRQFKVDNHARRGIMNTMQPRRQVWLRHLSDTQACVGSIPTEATKQHG